MFDSWYLEAKSSLRHSEPSFTPPPPEYVVFCWPLLPVSVGKSSSCGCEPLGAPTMLLRGDPAPKWMRGSNWLICPCGGMFDDTNEGRPPLVVLPSAATKPNPCV